MSFNIRYGLASDGEHSWVKRRPLVAAQIRQQRPDVLCLQEALRFQLDDLAADVPGYAELGVGRDDGKTAGEYAAILYDAQRLQVMEEGHFWFSDQADVPGSMTWGNRVTRLCTWVHFQDRHGPGFFVYNLHLDHESQPSRERSVQLLQQRLASRSSTAAVIVCGDFNAEPSNSIIRRLLTPSGLPGHADVLVDTFAERHPRAVQAATFNGFGSVRRARRIDYIFVSKSAELIAAEILEQPSPGSYASDHEAIIARIRF